MRNCNPNSPKAGNPLYTCNHATGRWNKIRAAARHGQDLTVAELRQLARLEGIRGYSRMTKARLIQALAAGAAPPAPAKKAVPAKKASPAKKNDFAVVCKEMERECPMPESLEAEPWCDHRADDVFYLKDGGHVYCHTAREIYNIIEANIPSYQMPYVKAQLPTCPFSRRLLPMRLLDDLVGRIRDGRVPPPTDDKVRAFLRLRHGLYQETANVVNAVTRSNRIKAILRTVLNNDRIRNPPRGNAAVVAFVTGG